MIDDGISAATHALMEEVAHRYGFTLRFLDCSDMIARLEANNIPKWRGGYTAYLKLFAFSRIEEERILYLDCDIIVKNDISVIFDEYKDMEKPLAMAEDMTICDNTLYCTYIYGNMEETYYNCGTLLCDIPRWKEQGCEEALLTYMCENKKKLMYWEQDVLNLALRGKIATLSNKYNFCTPQLYFGPKLLGKLFGWSRERVAAYTALQETYCVGHCFAVFKERPWHENSRHPLAAEYAAYYREIYGKPYKGTPAPVALSDKLQYLLYKCCRPVYVWLHNFFTKRLYKSFINTPSQE